MSPRSSCTGFHIDRHESVVQHHGQSLTKRVVAVRAGACILRSLSSLVPQVAVLDQTLTKLRAELQDITQSNAMEMASIKQKMKEAIEKADNEHLQRSKRLQDQLDQMTQDLTRMSEEHRDVRSWRESCGLVWFGEPSQLSRGRGEDLDPRHAVVEPRTVNVYIRLIDFTGRDHFAQEEGAKRI